MLITVLKAIAFVTFLGITVGLVRSPIGDTKSLEKGKNHSKETYLEKKNSS